MRVKLYRMRSFAMQNGKRASVDLALEFQGKRAFVIWDSVNVGAYELKARLEINPKFLQRVDRHCCDYIYSGQLVLPRPEHN